MQWAANLWIDPTSRHSNADVILHVAMRRGEVEKGIQLAHRAASATKKNKYCIAHSCAYGGMYVCLHGEKEEISAPPLVQHPWRYAKIKKHYAYTYIHRRLIMLLCVSCTLFNPSTKERKKGIVDTGIQQKTR